LKLDDPAFDSIGPEARDTHLLEALRRQIVFMRDEVPFWRERLTKSSVDEAKIEGFAGLAQIQIFTKEELRDLRPAVLLPEGSRRTIAVGRWTSGTSGRPTVNFWSTTDWACLVASTARMLAREAATQNPTAFNCYTQAHLTGPLYDGAIRRLGGIVYDRSHHSEDVFSTLAQADLFDFDTVILPSRTLRGKGLGLGALLEEDPNFLARHGVRWWIASSATVDVETAASARRQGVQVVSNLYGSSEFGLFAISCPTIPRDYHVAQGHVLVEVVDRSGVPVAHGQFGRIVVTHLCGMDENGQACRHSGTQILRLAIGDGATLLTDPCTCGLTTPRLRDVRRVETKSSSQGS
jgi:phenylacetate-CoA ligase